MRRFVNDALVSCGTLAALLVALVLVDDRLRDHLSRTMRGVSAAGFNGARTELAEVVPVLLAAARDQSIAHGPMVIFAAVAAVLFICMIRT
jgi:hypothetical protein